MEKKKNEEEIATIGKTLLSLMMDFVHLAGKVNSLEEKIQDPESKLKIQYCVRHLTRLENRFVLLIEDLRRKGIIDRDLFLKLSSGEKEKGIVQKNF